MISPERQRLTVNIGLIFVASIAAVVALVYPTPVFTIIGTIIVIAAVVPLLYRVLNPPALREEPEPVGPAFPPDFNWKPEVMMVVGAGTGGNNILYREITLHADTKESNEYGSRFRSNRRGDDLMTTWPDFNDDNINELLYSALTGFVAYPRTVGARADSPDFQGWRYPPLRTEETVPGTLAPGGRVYFEPHDAALGPTSQAIDFMKERRQEIRGIIEREETFHDLSGVVHLVAAGNTGISFFKEIDVKSCVTLDSQWKYHVILYVEGGVEEIKRVPLIAAFKDQLDDMRQFVTARGQGVAGAGGYLPVILTDNLQGRSLTKLDHMALTLMLAGSCASANNVIGDPFRLMNVASLYAPFVPKHKSTEWLLSKTRNVNDWADQFVKLDPRDWTCLWSDFKTDVDLKERAEVVVILAGDENACVRLFDRVEEKFYERGIRATAIGCNIPGAKTVWMAGCVPLTVDEVKDSLMAEVFKPLAKGAETVDVDRVPQEGEAELSNP